MTLLRKVVLNAPPAFNASKMNVPFAAVAGNEIKLPASPDEPEVIGPAVDESAPENTPVPVTAKFCPKVTGAASAALILPAVSEKTGIAFAVDGPPENETEPAPGSALNTKSSIP